MKYLFLVTLIIATLGANGQKVDKYNIIGMSAIIKDKDGEYLYQKGWVACNDTSIIDIYNKKVIMHQGDKILTYSIIASGEAYQDKEKNVIFKMTCLDGYNTKCGIRFITLADPTEEYSEFLKVEYADMAILYRIKEIE